MAAYDVGRPALARPNLKEILEGDILVQGRKME